MIECEDCKRAVRQEGEGAMCFNCHLAKSVPLPTRQEIEDDDYSTDQVVRMLERIAELEAEVATCNAEALSLATALHRRHQILLGCYHRAELEAQQQWVPVGERLPLHRRATPRSRALLVRCPDNKCTYVATYNRETEVWENFGGGSGLEYEYISHWMPLPAPPQEETGDE